MSPARSVVLVALFLLLSGCISEPAQESGAPDLDGPGPESFNQEADEPGDEWVGHEVQNHLGDPAWAYYAVDRYEAGGGCPGDHELEAVASTTSDSGFLVRFPVPGCWIEGTVHVNESMRWVSAHMHFTEETVGMEGRFNISLDDEGMGSMRGSGPPGGGFTLLSTKTRAAGDHKLRVVSDQDAGEIALFDRFEVTPWTEAKLALYGEEA